MTKKLALLVLFAAHAAIAVAYGSAFLPGGTPPWAAWALAFAIAAAVAALIVIGAARHGRIGRLRWVILAVVLDLGVGFALLLALPAAQAPGPTLWLGLPPRAAVLLYGIGVIPLLLVPLAYALTFDELTLDDAALGRVRAVARQRPTAAAAGPTDADAPSRDAPA